MTLAHGRHLGLVRGGRSLSYKVRAIYGALVRGVNALTTTNLRPHFLVISGLGRRGHELRIMLWQGAQKNLPQTVHVHVPLKAAA